MRIYVFENFPWLPWAEIAAMLLVILPIVLAIRAKRRLWKILLTLCVPVLVDHLVRGCQRRESCINHRW